MIAEIRARFPGSIPYLFTLDPENTERLHRIPCFPITFLSTAHLGRASTVPPVGAGSRKTGVSSLCARMVRTARGKLSGRFPRGILPGVPNLSLNTLGAALRMVLGEAAHTRKAYELSRVLDFLIASGGGQLDDYWGGPWGHPYALFKWALIAKLTGTEFLMLSLGTCSLGSRLSRFFIGQALKRASYRSYRDEASRRLLKSEAFTRDDPVFPDLAFGYPVEKMRRFADNAFARPAGSAMSTGRTVGISPIAYLSRFGWPERDDEVFHRYMGVLVAFTSTLMDAGYSVLLFATAFSDHAVVDEVMAALRTGRPDGISGMSRPPISTVDDLFASLSGVDCVVASRLHGVLLSHMAGKPVLAVSYDRKVDAYMAEMGQAEYCLDIHRLDLGSLSEKYSSLEAHAESVSVLITTKINDCRDRLHAQYGRVFGKYQGRMNDRTEQSI